MLANLKQSLPSTQTRKSVRAESAALQSVELVQFDKRYLIAAVQPVSAGNTGEVDTAHREIAAIPCSRIAIQRR